MSDKIKKTVSWFVVKKGLIKFEKDEDSIQIADNVMDVSDFTKYPVQKGDVVDVTIDTVDDKEQVVFLRKIETDSKKKDEPKKSSNTTDSEEQSITKEVYCVSKYGLKFVGDNGWTNFTDELQEKDVKSMGIIAKNTITVSLNSEGKIFDIKKVETKQTEPKKVELKTKYGSANDLIARAKNSASMNAKDVIVALINVGREEVNSKDKIEKAIFVLTKKFYDVLTKL